MKKILFFLLFIQHLLFALEKKNIAVLTLDAQGIEQSEANLITDKLRVELINTQKFTVIERSAMKEMLQEQGFQQSGCTSQECAVEIGQLMGVDRMIAGSIGKIEQTFFISIRMIDVGTGNIAKTAEEEITGSLTDVFKYGIKRIAQKMAGIKVDELPKLTVLPPKQVTIRSAQSATEQNAYIPRQPRAKPAKLTPLGLGSFSVEAFGLLLFGPSLNIEFRIKENLYIAPVLRLASMGMVYRLLQGDDPSDVTGLGFGASIINYAKNPYSNNKVFYGAGLEIISGSYVDGKGEAWEVSGSDNNLVIYGKGGYRWRLPSSVIF